MANRTTAIALFDDRIQAGRAIAQLKSAGFTEKHIGVTSRGDDETDRGVGDGHKETHAKEGAIAGVATGAGVGALWGLGILAGVLPAIGPAIAGGTLVALLSSAAAGAATAGVAGALIGLGIPEDEANYYETEFKAGRPLVTGDAGDRVAAAQAILVEKGGYDMRTASARTSTMVEDATVEDAIVEDEVVQVDDDLAARETIRVDKRGRAIPPQQR